ncbi:hypothetical protein HUU62_16170 [Rhodoferax sp. 4810]|nr:hypothetical protein [Rhodoferax jenense]
MSPLLTLLATQPQLLVEHLQGYSALLTEELQLASQRWRRQALLQVAAFCSLSVAVVLGGVALMLWATAGALPVRAPWVLWATPLLPFAVAVVCLLMVRKPADTASFANLSRQLNADMALLRAAGSA